MKRGQNINTNRSLEEDDSNLHRWLWGLQDFTRGSNSRCGTSKRTGIRSGAWRVTELLPSCGKTSTDEELLLIDEERKQFPEMDAIHVKGVAKTVEMARRDLEHSTKLPDKGLAELRGHSRNLEECLPWVKHYQTFLLPPRERLLVKGSVHAANVTVVLF